MFFQLNKSFTFNAGDSVAGHGNLGSRRCQATVAGRLFRPPLIVAAQNSGPDPAVAAGRRTNGPGTRSPRRPTTQVCTLTFPKRKKVFFM